MNGVALPPDLEQFVTEAVASGRFRDIEDVVRTGVDLVRRRENTRTEFIASLEAAQQNGFHSLDDMLAELDNIIGEGRTRPGVSRPVELTAATRIEAANAV